MTSTISAGTLPLREEIAYSGDVRSPSVALVSNNRPSSRRSRLTVSIVTAAVLAAGAAAFGIYGTSGLSEAPDSREPISAAGPSESARLQSTLPGQTGSTEEIWRHLAAGNRQGVLQLLQSSAGDRDAGPDARVAASVIETVRVAALQARQAAVSRSSESYRSGEEQLALSSRLEKNGRPIDALRALWQLRISTVNRRRLSKSNRLETRSTHPSRRGSGPNARGADQPSPRSDEPAAPEPARELRQKRRTPLESPALHRTRQSRSQIRTRFWMFSVSITERMKSRYLRRAASVPITGSRSGRTIRRTFDGMSEYKMEMRNPRVEMQGDSAVAFATVARRMVPRVGRPVINQVETEFRLRRDGGRWVITAVTARRASQLSKQIVDSHRRCDTIAESRIREWKQQFAVTRTVRQD